MENEVGAYPATDTSSNDVDGNQSSRASVVTANEASCATQLCATSATKGTFPRLVPVVVPERAVEETEVARLSGTASTERVPFSEH